MPRSAPGPVNGAPVEQDAAGARPVEAGDDAQQGRFPAAGRPEDGDEVVLGDGEARRLQRPGRGRAAMAGEGAGDAVDRELHDPLPLRERMSEAGRERGDER